MVSFVHVLGYVIRSHSLTHVPRHGASFQTFILKQPHKYYRLPIILGGFSEPRVNVQVRNASYRASIWKTLSFSLSLSYGLLWWFYLFKRNPVAEAGVTTRYPWATLYGDSFRRPPAHTTEWETPAKYSWAKWNGQNHLMQRHHELHNRPSVGRPFTFSNLRILLRRRRILQCVN